VTEHSLQPPPVYVLLNPGLNNFSGRGIKKSLDRTQSFQCTILITAPVRHFWIILFIKRHVRLPSAVSDSLILHQLAKDSAHGEPRPSRGNPAYRGLGDNAEPSEGRCRAAAEQLDEVAAMQSARDVRFMHPPRIPCGFPAYGSCLGCMTAQIR
jgi:hypothetical protein